MKDYIKYTDGTIAYNVHDFVSPLMYEPDNLEPVRYFYLYGRDDIQEVRILDNYHYKVIDCRMCLNLDKLYLHNNLNGIYCMGTSIHTIESNADLDFLNCIASTNLKDFSQLKSVRQLFCDRSHLVDVLRNNVPINELSIRYV